MATISYIVPLRLEFTTTGLSDIVEIGGAAHNYSIQVVGSDEAATSWNIDLLISLNGKNFDPVLTHTTGTGDGRTYSSGNQVFPATFIRVRVNALDLGSAIKLSVFVMATP